MRKQYILYIVVILLSIINAINFNNASALSYSSEVGVGFTFNPTLSISLSSSDLVISNLVPGSALDSNVINVSVASNASYGYILSATVGNNSTYNSDSLINNVDNNQVFSNIALDADLSDLEDSEDTNIWGYSYQDNTVNTPTWSNYNGLSLYSSTNPTTLLDLNSNTSTGTSSLDFKIAAKASNTQPSGEYGNIINFMAVSKVGTVSLLDAFIASDATMQNGYYTMQGMTPAICNAATIGSSLQLLDVRDNKLYWVTKLADNNCWMTQNLDLDLSHEVALTSETSDIDPDSYSKTIYTVETGYSKDETTNVVSWLPSAMVEVDDGQGGVTQVQRADTIDMVWSSNTAATALGWANDDNKPYSADAGNRYKYTDDAGNETVYTSYNACLTGTNNDKAGCQHTYLGNYYNWSAAVASNDSTNFTAAFKSPTNSICPKNWYLPTTAKYNAMLSAEEITANYNPNGFLKIRTSTLYFVRSGYIRVNGLNDFNKSGNYWQSSVFGSTGAYSLRFNNSEIKTTIYNDRFSGKSVRCLAK